MFSCLEIAAHFQKVTEKAQTLGVSREKQAPPPPPPQPSSPINFCILAFFHLKYDILYAWSYTGVRKNDLEHMENIWKKCILLTMIEQEKL